MKIYCCTLDKMLFLFSNFPRDLSFFGYKKNSLFTQNTIDIDNIVVFFLILITELYFIYVMNKYDYMLVSLSMVSL